MPTNNPSNQRILAIAAVIVVTLLALNAFLLFNKYKQDKVIAGQQADIEEADKLKIELEKQYYEALTDLEELRTGNDELNAMIDQQKEELKQQKNRIERLLGDVKELKKARVAINNLNVQVKKYIGRIEQLNRENELLAMERDSLSDFSRRLLLNLDSAQRANLELYDERATLSSKAERLTTERSEMLEVLTKASVVKVNKVQVTGLKKRSNGKLVKKKFAKNVEQLRVCFKTTVNEITKPGPERFYIRIVNPVGETIAVDDLGSGVLQLAGSREEVRYTLWKEVDYQNDNSEICLSWKPANASFQKGKYKVEVYNKNYLAGTGQLTLK
ncbi:MAG: hypothetical protein ACE5FF_05520 [Saprospiraceae bacterium]